ncbi:flagellar motor protein MotB [Paenibacillus sp. SC116]|uniref:OmpA/MotB family protein n=1 Tax=Paenibacillus sp. SC116 TaxID=2968986 RepID=UPI00215B15FB|nr:flagellar motor protein MotB [Paenibacillus sp. SC116]MCR8844834.1 flagellar motor protein MotB [Paenibacillus sp. SC116]
MRRRSRRRGQAPAAENQERWLITYADLITLLMIFFVVMYAMSQVDLTKYESLSSTLQSTFNNSGGNGALPEGSGILEGAHTKPGETGGLETKVDGGSGDYNTDNRDGKQPPSNQGVMIGQITQQDLAFRKQEQKLQDTMKKIQQYIDENDLQNSISVSDVPKGIEIRLSDRLLFSLGQSELTAQAEPTLTKLASLFSQLDSMISIEGHTDNLPFASGSRYKDNWELSAERALSVLRFFISEHKLKTEQFQIAGYGDTRPVATNDTVEGRQKNRRVEIIILRGVMRPTS